MGKEKGIETDQTTQCEHSPLACHSNSNQCNHHINSSSDRSNASAVTAKHRKTVVENTTACALKLKELVIEGELPWRP